MPDAPNLLRRWLGLEGYGSKARLARDLGVTVSLVGAWLTGRKQPSLTLAVALERVTRGLVPATAWADEGKLDEVDARVRAREKNDTGGVDSGGAE